MTLKAVILDIDGTLLLSNDAHAQAWVESFAAYGYNVPFDQISPLLGMGGDQVIPKMVRGLTDAEGDGKAIAERRKELMISRAPTLPPTNGSRELILKMQQEKLSLVVATSATKQEVSLLLKAAQVDDLLHEITTADDVKASKPAPDIVEVALNQLGVEASEAVMLADTPFDIEAAGKCGVGVIALRSGGFSDDALKGAIAIYNDPADLSAHYRDSPLGKNI